MKKINFTLILALCLAPTLALAQGPKIGVVNANRVVQECKKGKAFFTELEGFKKKKDDEIKGQITTAQNMQKDAQAKAASMSDDKKREIANNLEKMEREIKRLGEDAQRETTGKLNEGLERFQRELGPLIRQIALEQGLQLVFNDGPSSGIVFRDPSVDITDAVIKKYDEMNP
jgi:outer membrane protein